MYRPPALEITDQTALATFARRHPFATLITSWEGNLEVSHIPLLCDVQPLRVRGHVARANPQASHLAHRCPLRMIFHGPHRYVSPDGSPAAPLLPTWNYAAVHGKGWARVLSDDDARGLLHDLVERLERGRERPWHLGLAGELVDQLFPEIVAFEVEELSLEGRLKLTRDQNLQDWGSAVEALSGTNDRVEREILALLKMQGPPRG
jgi:transcriptional regulator